MRLYLCMLYLAFSNLFHISNGVRYDPSEIHGYHFHTYFFQNNLENTREALDFRDAIQQQISNGSLANCRLNHVNMIPRGPHPVGSYETCCNHTSVSSALSWFMLNHGNLSILLHPLTRMEVQDHTERSMFLGPRIPLDISVLDEDLGDNVDLCLPLPSDSKSKHHEDDISLVPRSGFQNWFIPINWSIRHTLNEPLTSNNIITSDKL